MTGGRFDVDDYRRERIRRLEAENRMLAAERRRLERVLVAALQVATDKDRRWVALDGNELVEVRAPAEPLELLERLFVTLGINPERPAWVEEREKAERDEQWRQESESFERFLQALERIAA